VRVFQLSCAILAAFAALVWCVAPTGARAAAASKTVRYRGVALQVPRAWPVYDLARHPRLCVRFNRHAVYLGSPGPREACPPQAFGRTEAILVVPGRRRRAALAGAQAVAAALSSTPEHDAAADGGASVVDVGAGAGQDATIIATWRSDRSVIDTALARVGGRTAAVPVAHRLAPPGRPGASSAHAGAVFSGEGFDTCQTPDARAMDAWHASPYRAVGVYIGGANMACAQSQLTRGWVRGRFRAGWRLLPIYVGLQAATSSCGCATISPARAGDQGAAAARDAIVHARKLGLGTGAPIYYDMENYTRGGTASSAVLTFLEAWTRHLHAAGYLSGVYAGANSGVSDLIAATSHPDVPDELWTADWNGHDDAANSRARTARWGANRRVHQYAGETVQRFGGVTLSVDRDAVDAPAAIAAPAPTAPLSPSGSEWVLPIARAAGPRPSAPGL
jgi:hypothetical protein